MTEFAAWDNFYLIVGSAAGALIGLQFVVMTLIAERPHLAVPEAGAAFATPTIVHFCAVLLISALTMVPWHSATSPRVLWGIMGFCGVAYSLIVIRRLLRQSRYKPQFEDWLFHAILPLISYAILALAAFLTQTDVGISLFCVGAAALLLLLIGIHNAWDAVSYHVFVNLRNSESKPDHAHHSKREKQGN